MRLSRTLLAATVAVAAALAFAAFAAASVPQPFNATGQLLSLTSTDSRTAGPNDFELVLATISSTGTFTGVYVGQAANIIHANGQTQLHFTYTATGTTPCGTGSFQISGNGPVAADGTETGHYTTVKASTDTVGIQLDVSFFIDFNAPNPLYTMTGTYHCT